MANTRKKLVAKRKTPFDFICQYARDANYQAIRDLIATGISINCSQGMHVPVSLLASEGLHGAVNQLVENFGANRVKAAFGYALVGNVEYVDIYLKPEDGLREKSIVACGYIQAGRYDKALELSEAGPMRRYLARGYATIGDHEKVDEYCKENVNKSDMIKGYIDGGYIDQALRLHLNGNMSSVILGYFAQNGYVGVVNQLMSIKKGVFESMFAIGARQGFEHEQASGFWQTKECALRVLSLIDSSKLRVRLASLAVARIAMHDGVELGVEETHQKNQVLLCEAAKINSVMHKYTLSYDEANCYVNMGIDARIWLLLTGPDAKNSGFISRDVFLLLSAYAIGRPDFDIQSVNRVRFAVCANTAKGAEALLDDKYQYGLFGKPRYAPLVLEYEQKLSELADKSAHRRDLN